MACGFWAAPTVARALTTQAAGETFTWSVNESASVSELNRFTAGDVVEIHCATEFAQGKRITVAAAWTPSPILESGGQPIAPYGVGMNIGIPSFDQDEYHSFVATNWYEDVANWPDAPGPMSTAHQEFFYRNSTANVVRLSFMGTWLGNPTNVSRSGTTKWVQIFVWSFSDVYGTEDAANAPWVKGFGMSWTPLQPSLRKPPFGCGGCARMGLPVFRINMATLAPVIQDVDFAWEGLGPDMRLARTHSGDPSERGLFGNGWEFSYDAPNVPHRFGREICLPDGRRALFTAGTGTNDAFIPAAGLRDELIGFITNDMVHYRYRDKASDLFHLFETPMLIWPSTDFGTRYPLRAIEDRNGNAVQLTWASNRLIRITDAAGRAADLTYDPAGLCTNVRVPNGGNLAFSYDGAGNLVQTRDLAGNVTTYVYDGENRIVAMDTAGRTWTFAYAYGGRSILSRVVDPLGRTNQVILSGGLDNRQGGFEDAQGEQSWFSTADGLLLSESDENGQTTTHQYDDRGFPTNTVNPRGYATRRAYDGRRNLVRATRPDGTSTTFAYDGQDRVTHVTNALGGVTRFEYDGRGNPVRIVTPAGRATGMGYDALGQLVAVTNPAGAVTRFSYNAFGRLAGQIDPAGNRVDWGYDAAGIDSVALTNARGFATRFEYDANRRLTRLVHPDGTAVRYEYDCCALTAIIDENGHTNRLERNALLQKTAWADGAGGRTETAYDGNGHPTNVVDSVGRVVAATYDPAGRLQNVRDAGGANTFYDYDANGNVVSLTRDAFYLDPPGMLISLPDYFVYDSNDRMVSNRYAGQAVYSRFEWDALDRLTNRVNARGQSIRRTYDPDGLLLGVHRPEGSDTYAYDAAGRLTNWTGAAGGAAWTRDVRGDVARVRYGDGREVAITHSPTRRIETMAYPGGTTVSYQRDGRDRITNMAWGAHSMAFAYDGVGRLLSVQRSNGTASQFRYDRAGRMTNLAHQVPAGTLLDLRIQRNAAGDTTNLLKTGGFMPWDVPLAPDEIGMTIQGGLYQINGSNCQWDADGNVAGVPAPFGWTAEYDAANRPTAIRRGENVAAYAYDGFNRCVRIERGGETRNLHWDHRDRLIFETDARQQLTALYLYRERDLVAMWKPQTGWHFYHFDANGNTIGMTDETGAISAMYRHWPYGWPGFAYARVRNPFTFAGRYGVLDEGAGFYYMRNRFYHAGVRRFLGADPIGHLGDLNLYAYARGNPVDRIDPDGLDSDDPAYAVPPDQINSIKGNLTSWALFRMPLRTPRIKDLIRNNPAALTQELEDNTEFWAEAVLNVMEQRRYREAEQDCGGGPPPRSPEAVRSRAMPQSFDDQAAASEFPAPDDQAAWVALSEEEGWWGGSSSAEEASDE